MMPVSACGRFAATLMLLSSGPFTWSQAPLAETPRATPSASADPGAPGHEEGKSSQDGVPSVPVGEARAFLGVCLVEIPEAVLHHLPVAARNGLLVDLVAPDSSASKAGVLQNDILLKVDDQKILTTGQMVELLEMRKPGEQISLEVFRAGKNEVLQATLGAAAPGKTLQAAGEIDRKRAGAERLLALLEQHPDLTNSYPDLLKRVLQDLGADSAEKKGKSAMGLIRAIDPEGEVEIRQDGGNKTVKVTDLEGKVQFEGPITTEEDRTALPEKIRARIARVEKSLQKVTEGKWDKN